MKFEYKGIKKSCITKAIPAFKARFFAKSLRTGTLEINSSKLNFITSYLT